MYPPSASPAVPGPHREKNAGSGDERKRCFTRRHRHARSPPLAKRRIWWYGQDRLSGRRSQGITRDGHISTSTQPRRAMPATRWSRIGLWTAARSHHAITTRTSQAAGPALSGACDTSRTPVRVHQRATQRSRLPFNQAARRVLFTVLAVPPTAMSLLRTPLLRRRAAIRCQCPPRERAIPRANAGRPQATGADAEPLLRQVKCPVSLVGPRLATPGR
jgi:hypothetical protein